MKSNYLRVYQRGTRKGWQCDFFTQDGTRHRIALPEAKTKRQAEKQALEKLSQAENGLLTGKAESFVKLPFDQAADKYLVTRRLELKPSSYAKEKQLLVSLREFFKSTHLSRITHEDLLAYRENRAKSCGPAIINMETGILRRILKRARRWHVVGEDVRPLREPATIGRALIPEQQAKLLAVAASKPEWQTCYLAAVLALNSTLRGCELKALTWQDVDLLNDTLYVRQSKTDAGVRAIPLNRDAQGALETLRARAESFGEVLPEHYCFASYKPVGRFDGLTLTEICVSEFDPTQPIRSWKKAWGKVTAKAGLPGLRFHDLRHTAITILAESAASEQTIKAIAGHVSNRMLERYSHIRLEAKRNAIEALSRTESGRNLVTSFVTSKPAEKVLPA